MPLRNLKVVLAYDGTPYSGWQVQLDRPTVQGTLALAIARITGGTVLPQGSGRTDAGVHALGQVASFATASTIPEGNFRKALNDILPASIRILSVEEVEPGFHPRHSAKSKTYRYRIFRGEICPPFLANYVHHHPYPLDEGAMMRAADAVAGEHDFTSFAAVDPSPEFGNAAGRGNPFAEKAVAQEVAAYNVRTIFSSVWEQHDHDNELVYTVRGNGFLHHMVRNLVGTFLLVGKGTLRSADMSRILRAKARSAAGATAPASGLYLVNVEY